MKTKHLIKRLVCLTLALFMVIGMMPMNAHAAEYGDVVDAAIIFTDLHTSNSNYKESTVQNIFGAVKNTGLPFSLVVSGGDAFSVNSDSSKYTGDTSKITGYIHNALGDGTIPVHYVWSDHDRYGTGIDKNSGFVYGAGDDGIYGTADDGNYYVYSLSMADISTDDRYSAGFHSNSAITATIAEFVADAAKLDQSKPLLITSHQPLMDRRNDNGHAYEWAVAINQVAENMDVAFFFGHNHRYDVAEDYFRGKGDSMNVCSDSSGNYKTLTLNFSHMCAGYMSPANSSSTTRTGTVMVVTIHEEAVRYTSYSNSGIYTGSYAVDVYVPRDHAATEPELVVSGTDAYFVGQALDLTVGYKTGSKVEDVTASAVIEGFDMNTVGDQTVTVSYDGLTAEFPIQVRQKVFADAATGVTVEVEIPGATALTVSNADTEAFDQVGGMLSSAVGYEISLTGFGEGSAVVTLPIPTGVDTPAVCRINADGTVSKLSVSTDDGIASVTVDAFGTFLIGQEEITEALENSLVGGATVYEEKTVYVEADSFVDGGKYLIVGETKASNGDLIAYLNNSGSEGWVVVTPDADGCIELSNANAVWTASGSDSAGYTLTNNGRYIGGTDANTLKSSASQAVKVKYDASANRLKTASGTTRYLYYSTNSSENWKWSTSSGNSTSSKNMYIYKEETILIPVSSPVTYTVEAEDLHHVLATDSAELSFGLLADGAAAELPEGAAWSFEVKNDRSGVIESVTDAGVITFTGEIGSCYVKISCNWDEGTVYKYVKVTTEADPNACDHSYTAVTTEPTCTADGLVTYTCVCGDSYTEVIPALGHD